MKLTLVSYNIHRSRGRDGRVDVQRIGQVLAELRPDIVALQEVEDGCSDTKHSNQPMELGERLGLHVAFGPNIVREGHRYGNAILSRLPIRRSRNYDLSVQRREPRGALRCDLELSPGRQLHVFCLHLGLSVRERRAQEALLLSADILRDAVRSDPTIVCGDFNYWLDGPVASLVRQAIHDAGWVLGSKGRTYPTSLPLLRLDRIFVDAGVRPLALKVHRSPLSRTASDHLPLAMEFETPQEELHVGSLVELFR